MIYQLPPFKRCCSWFQMATTLTRAPLQRVGFTDNDYPALFHLSRLMEVRHRRRWCFSCFFSSSIVCCCFVDVLEPARHWFPPHPYWVVILTASRALRVAYNIELSIKSRAWMTRTLTFAPPVLLLSPFSQMVRVSCVILIRIQFGIMTLPRLQPLPRLLPLPN